MAEIGEKLELKDRHIDRNRFCGLLRDWADALEREQDLRVNVKGQDKTVPKSAYANANLEIEYEIKQGEGEFEMTMKWPVEQ